MKNNQSHDIEITMNYINQQVNYMKINGFPGLCSDLAEIQGFGSTNWDGENSDSSEQIKPSDELIIQLPYAGSNFVIRLLFNLHEPWMPPDISLSDDKFTSLISPVDLGEKVPTLNSWSHRKEEIISHLLDELMRLFKRYQTERLVEDEVLDFEYKSLIKALEIREGDIEVWPGEAGLRTSSLLVRLPMNLKDVPPILMDGNPGTVASLLHIKFQGPEGGFTPALHLSPGLEALIGGSSTLGLPAVAPRTSLSDYVGGFLQLLECKVKGALLSFETRKQFIAQTLCQMGSGLLEYDAEKFMKIVLFCDWKEFHVVVNINLSLSFPQEGPKIVLQSIYHNSPREPFSRELPDLGYSPTWSHEETVLHIRQHILQHIGAFQNNSTRTGQ